MKRLFALFCITALSAASAQVQSIQGAPPNTAVFWGADAEEDKTLMNALDNEILRSPLMIKRLYRSAWESDNAGVPFFQGDEELAAAPLVSPEVAAQLQKVQEIKFSLQETDLASYGSIISSRPFQSFWQLSQQVKLPPIDESLLISAEALTRTRKSAREALGEQRNIGPTLGRRALPVNLGLFE